MQVLVDGYNGLLIVNPTRGNAPALRRTRIAGKARSRSALTQLRETKSTTRDGRHIVLSANIELPDEVDRPSPPMAPKASVSTAPNFSTSIATTLPTEEEQYETYRTVAERVAPHPLIIRTFDLGGDKIADAVKADDELNPFLGCRAIRFCLEHPGDFQGAVARDSARQRCRATSK